MVDTDPKYGINVINFDNTIKYELTIVGRRFISIKEKITPAKGRRIVQDFLDTEYQFISSRFPIYDEVRKAKVAGIRP